jgi:hypothetical protein
MKIGLECEGEFKGLRTLFLDSDEMSAAISKKNDPGPNKAFVKILRMEVEQIYICDHDNFLDLYCQELEILAAQKKRITVERTVFHGAPFYINVMLYVQCGSFWNLRGQDQIKFEKELNVYSIQKSSMIYTAPVEFSSDVPLKGILDD